MMLKTKKPLTESAQKTKKVYEYVLECIDVEGTEEEKITKFFESFKSEYSFNILVYKNIQRTIEEYLKGLPSVIDMAFYNYEIIELLIQWGFLTSKSTEKKTNTEIDLYWHRLAGALTILGGRYGLTDKFIK